MASDHQKVEGKEERSEEEHRTRPQKIKKMEGMPPKNKHLTFFGFRIDVKIINGIGW